MASNETCTFREGALPGCAPLAVAAVPMQIAAEPAFDPAEALAKGTLFPGLDLPFMDYAAAGGGGEGPLAELMALDFVAHELALYLDTHADDAEAFEAWKCFQGLAAEGRERYAAMNGPVTVSDNVRCRRWVWPEDPWPWDGRAAGGDD